MQPWAAMLSDCLELASNWVTLSQDTSLWNTQTLWDTKTPAEQNENFPTQGDCSKKLYLLYNFTVTHFSHGHGHQLRIH